MASWIRWAWDWFANLWTAKDIAIALYVAVGGAAVIGPLLALLFTPLSTFDVLVVDALFGLVAVLCVHLLLKRVRLAPPPPTFAELNDTDLHEHARKWLEHQLSNKKLRAAEAFLFGSVVHTHYATSDVDVVVYLGTSKDREIAKAGRLIKDNVARDFQRTFGHRLHVQLFSPQEKESKERFLSDAGKVEEIKLG